MENINVNGIILECGAYRKEKKELIRGIFATAKKFQIRIPIQLTKLTLPALADFAGQLIDGIRARETIVCSIPKLLNELGEPLRVQERVSAEQRRIKRADKRRRYRKRQQQRKLTLSQRQHNGTGYQIPIATLGKSAATGKFKDFLQLNPDSANMLRAFDYVPEMTEQSSALTMRSLNPNIDPVNNQDRTEITAEEAQDAIFALCNNAGKTLLPSTGNVLVPVFTHKSSHRSDRKRKMNVKTVTTSDCSLKIPTQLSLAGRHDLHTLTTGNDGDEDYQDYEYHDHLSLDHDY